MSSQSQSSQSQGRYQSKLFNFVHRQSRRLTEQFGQTWRQVQVVTKWGVGLIVFPIYKILHSVENSGKQIQGQAAPDKTQLKEASKDNPHSTTSDSSSQIVSYQGSLDDSLVKNKTQVNTEIDRLLDKLVGGNPKETSALVPINSQEETELEVSQSKPSKPSRFMSGMLKVLDNVVARLESNGLTPVLARGEELLKTAKTQLNIFVYRKDSEFFRDQLEEKGQIVPKAKRLPPRRKKLSSISGQEDKDGAENSWLTMKDLFGEEEVKDKLLPPATPKYSPQEILRSYNQFIQPQSGGELVKQQKVTSEISRSQKTSGKIARKETQESGLVKGERQTSSQMEAKPDWIETDAEPVGYDKHLMEVVLEWFDDLMAWLEDLAVKIFRLLQQFVRGK